MRYELRVVAPDRERLPLHVALGRQVIAELEHDPVAGDFTASLRDVDPDVPLTISAGPTPVAWAYRPNEPRRFAARLECGASVSLTADGFVPACVDWTLRIRLAARHDADGLRIRAFDANNHRAPIPALVAYDGGELIATFEELHFPARLEVRAMAQTMVGVGALTIRADP